MEKKAGRNISWGKYLKVHEKKKKKKAPYHLSVNPIENVLQKGRKI